MTAFPQLNSAAVAQFPFGRELRHRTLVNRDGLPGEVRFGDVDFEERSWTLDFVDLSDGEFAAVQALFDVCAGRLGTFTFLEPASNLLAWSESLEDPVWVEGGTGTLTPGQADPSGGMAATRIAAGGSGLTLAQTVSVPASYTYAASVWAKSSAAGCALVVHDGAGLSVQEPIAAAGDWKRYSLSYATGSSAESLRFELSVGAGGTADFFGPQLEAQRSPSRYKKTSSRSGVYAGARFDQDDLEDRLTGPGRHSTRVRIQWTPSLI